MAPTKGNPRHAFRFTPELWEQFCAAVERDPEKRDQSGVIRDLVRWYVRERGVKPVRPEKP